VGVSTDEELSNMIRFQSAYNASSRFITVINEMLETIVTLI
jgi:flagellar hook-associated protein 1 FlgK